LSLQFKKIRRKLLAEGFSENEATTIVRRIRRKLVCFDSAGAPADAGANQQLVSRLVAEAVESMRPCSMIEFVEEVGVKVRKLLGRN